ncbi:cyclase family protein [Kordiimonas aestuarii]|uniref:cyclase family protein n=1 Tax=Kordiimonas aestuarii TaxID=1005925 RepID=UPI0021CDF568|nr:cyclase family protein [Kordiimonas aestuarii]
MWKSLVLASSLSLPVSADPIDFATAKVFDLSHAYGPDTIFWPTSPIKFEHKELSYGETAGGYFYSAYSFCMPEHGGTHMDAPIHFYRGGDTVSDLALENLIMPAIVIDVRAQAEADRNFRLDVANIEAFEEVYGRIPSGSAVLLATGWDHFWPDVKAYMGDDSPGDASKLSFPSFGAEAISFLVKERGVKLIGIDTASIDYGKSKDFPVHQIVGRANIPALENLKSIDELPPKGATLIALPIKIKNGSGGPVRAVALVPGGAGK